MIMNSKVLKHFKTQDPVLHAFIARIEPLVEFSQKDSEFFFEAICDSIISQQLAVKAADTIFARFKNLFVDGKINPRDVLKMPDDKLREVGLSRAKAVYIKDLAQKVDSGQLDLSKLPLMEDEEVIAELVKVKGIGRWTAEMFLLFTLGREDIFSAGDLGLRNAIKKIYGSKTNEEIEEIIKKWSPYKSTASRILWKSLKV